MNAIHRNELAAYLHEFLRVDNFDDYGPNGLQVEGRPDIRRIATGVTATLALIERAAAWEADAILVHHGWFWRGEDPRVLGQRHRRLKALLASDISLFAYHLPLDAHPVIGNNAQLGARMGWQTEGNFGKQQLACFGSAPQSTLGELADKLTAVLRRSPLLIGDPQSPVGRVAWCTGAAQAWIEQAYMAGAATYISGEISEPTTHFAREMGIAYLACGHHASERYGVQALGEALAQRFGIEQRFFDDDNPA